MKNIYLVLPLNILLSITALSQTVNITKSGYEYSWRQKNNLVLKGNKMKQHFFSSFLSLILMILPCSQSYSQTPGQIDTTFGVSGYVITQINGHNSFVEEVLVQQIGRIIAVGWDYPAAQTEVGLAGYHPDGSLDLNFGTGGFATTDVNPGDDRAHCGVMKSDDKILIGGWSRVVGGTDALLIQYNQNGSLDQNFGNSGIKLISLNGSDESHLIEDIDLDINNKIIATGMATFDGWPDAFIARFDSLGNLDQTFGGSGYILIDINNSDDWGYSVVCQSDGKILVTGESWKNEIKSAFIRRYDSLGNLDTGFGTNGTVLITIGTELWIKKILLQDDNKILIGGSVKEIDIAHYHLIIRLNNNGSFDSSFGDNGKVIQMVGSYGSDIWDFSLQGNEKILASGIAGNSWCLVRYNTDGSLDSTFGSSGIVLETFPGICSSNKISDDKIILAGGNNTASQYRIGLAKYWLETPIPVEFESFTSTLMDDCIRLDWQTATELNNKGFSIERKVSDQIDWEEIGFVKGNGTTTTTSTYSYIDKNLVNGLSNYRLKQIDFDGKYKYSESIEIEVNLPIKYSLEQNYPNPFNPNTTIKYSVPQTSLVHIKVYDVLGNEVETLVQKEKPAGTYELTWNAVNLPSGVYFYQLRAGDFIETKKMILIK